ncbi:hypothetical protein LY78DRAFT_117709 [Colletotrichum sublineola]|nr:hypothetical protein LY78DRAFT_117709 [Colletotrichum sublineola]
MDPEGAHRRYEVFGPRLSDVSLVSCTRTGGLTTGTQAPLAELKARTKTLSFRYGRQMLLRPRRSMQHIVSSLSLSSLEESQTHAKVPDLGRSPHIEGSHPTGTVHHCERSARCPALVFSFPSGPYRQRNIPYRYRMHLQTPFQTGPRLPSSLLRRCRAPTQALSRGRSRSRRRVRLLCLPHPLLSGHGARPTLLTPFTGLAAAGGARVGPHEAPQSRRIITASAHSAPIFG